jgi:hypothetical protein
MSESVYVKFTRAHAGRSAGAVEPLPWRSAAELIRRGIAVPASDDLIPKRPVLVRQETVENAMAADAPERAVTRRGLWRRR